MTMPIRRGVRGLVWGVLGVGLLTGCQLPERPLAPEASPEMNPQLTFEALNLHQVDKEGRTVWKLQAQKAVADVQRRQVRAQQVVGDIYVQGRPRYRLRTIQVTLQEAQDSLTLKGDIVAEDLQDKTVVRASWLQWQPARKAILLKGRLTFRQPRLQGQAQEATIHLRENRLSLRQQVQVMPQKPALRITGEALDWRWREGVVQAPQPVQIVYMPESLVVKAGGGQMDFSRQVLQLYQGVEAVHPRGQLRAQTVEWRLDRQQITASGGVRYSQNDPPLTVAGAQAEGNLATRHIRVLQARSQVFLE